MKKSPLVSVVIPCYNDAEFIEEALDSVSGQTHENIEIIVVDDGSNYETQKLIEALAQKIDTLIHQPHSGVSAARNKGISAAKGEYIAVLDSDDYYEPKFCEKAIQAIHNQKSNIMVTSYGRIFGNVREPYVYKPKGGPLKSYLVENSSLAVLFRKEDWAKAGRYDEAMITGFEDWEFYIRLLKGGGEAVVIPEVLFNYRRKKRSRSTVANLATYELLEYIFLKHQDVYKEHFELFVTTVLKRAKKEKQERIKMSERLEWKVAKRLFQPYYKAKSFLKR